jgi:hypothetical protein
VELDDGRGDGGDQIEMIECSNLEKKKEKNKNQVLIKGKVSNRFLF